MIAQALVRGVPVERFKRELMTYGYTIVPPSIASPGHLRDRILKAVLDIAGAQVGDDAAARDDNPMGRQFFYLLGADRCFLDAVLNPPLLELVRYLIHEPIVSSVSANLKTKGSMPLPLHADQPIHPTPRSLVCTAAYLLTPSSEDLGGMCFVPFSHHLMRQPTPEEEPLDSAPTRVSIEAPAGSLVIWHGNTWHGANNRIVDGIRAHLLIHWCSKWMRPQEPYREYLEDDVLAIGGEPLEELVGASIYYGWTESGPEHGHRAAFRTARARVRRNEDANMTNRPSNPPTISQSDMLPGDVILSAGSTEGLSKDALLDRAILAIDQGNYTHSSLWDGQHVIEALTGGVKIDDPLSLTLENQALVDVYRFHDDGHGFREPDWPVAPLLAAARSFEGYTYGYTKLVLAGVLLLTCEIPDNRVMQVLLKLVEMPILDEVEKWLKDEHSMVCSEVVAEGYWDARTDPQNKYGLPIVLDGHRHFPNLGEHQAAFAAAQQDAKTPAGELELHRIRAKLAELFEKHDTPLQPRAPVRAGVTYIAGSPELPAAFVTPGDLQRSPNLELVGTLKPIDT